VANFMGPVVLFRDDLLLSRTAVPLHGGMALL
jgi:hypothetical protein